MSTEFYNRNWRMPNSWNGTEDNNTKFSNYSMSFDGSESINSSYVLPANTTTFSVSMWVNTTSLSTLQGLIGSQDSSSDGYWVSISSNNINFKINGTTTSASTSALSINTWFHLVVTYDGSNSKIYLNNSTPVSNSVTETINVTANTIIGRLPWMAFYYLVGKLDHCSIFDYELTALQVTQLYGSSSTGVGNPMAITNGRKPIFYAPLGDYSAYNGTEYLVPNSAVSDYVFDFTSSSKISTGNITSLNNVSNATYSFWFKATSSTGYPTSGALIGVETTNATNAYFYNNTFYIHTLFGGYITTAIPTLNQWHHVCCTFNAGSSEAFINGVSVGTKTGEQSTTNANAGTDFSIGYSPNYKFYFVNGEISNVSLFNTTLPATGTESVESLYNYGTPPDISSYSGLQGWWKLDASATFDGSNFSIPDDSSNSNTGTSSGMTAANLVQASPPLLVNEPYSRYAINMDGSGDYIETPNILQNASKATLNTWINFNDNSITAIFGKGNSTDFFSCYSWTNGVLYFWMKDGGVAGEASVNPFKQGAALVNIGDWNMLTVVFDGTQTGNNRLKIYLNAGSNNIVTNYSGTIPANLANTSDNFLIGKAPNATQTSNSKFSNFSIWNEALTSLQISELYGNRLPSNLNNHSAYSNLVSWWQLGDNMSYDSNVWTVIDEKGTNNGTGINLAPAEDSIVNGVGTTANGLSSGMGGADNILGEAPYSNSNALSYGMGVDAKSTSVPS